MKRKFSVIAAVILILGIAVYAYAELNNITARGVAGDLCFYDKSGNEIFCIEASNRLVSYPSGSGADFESGSSLKLAGTEITATAAQLNNAVAGTFAVSSKAITMSDDWVLSATEAKSTVLVISSGSGALSIVDLYIASGKVFVVRNEMGATVTIKKSAGTGVEIASGKTAVVMCANNDYVRVTADATH